MKKHTAVFYFEKTAKNLMAPDARPRVPTIFIKNGFRFFFYSHEGREPAHIHVIGRNGEMKVWLDPIEIARVYRLSAKDQREVLNVVRENAILFLEKWRVWHGPNS